MCSSSLMLRLPVLFNGPVGSRRTSAAAMAAPQEKRLRREIAVATVQLQRLSAERRRHADRERKRAKPVLERIHGQTFLIAATVGVLDPSVVELPRLFVYWHLKRMLQRNIGQLHFLDDAAIDVAIADACSGRLATDAAAAAVDDVDCRVHFVAARWLAECEVFLWLVNCNLLGASPPSQELFARFRRAFPASSMGLRFARMIQGVLDSTRVTEDWAKTFRRRWRVEFRQLPRANPLTGAELSDRVVASVVVCESRARKREGVDRARGCCWVWSLLRWKGSFVSAVF